MDYKANLKAKYPYLTDVDCDIIINNVLMILCAHLQVPELPTEYEHFALGKMFGLVQQAGLMHFDQFTENGLSVVLNKSYVTDGLVGKVRTAKQEENRYVPYVSETSEPTMGGLLGSNAAFGKDVWISSKIAEPENEFNTHDKPLLMRINVQSLSGSTDIALYGEKVTQMQKAVIQNSELSAFCGYNAKLFPFFTEGDLAYLDGASPHLDTEPQTYGANANYTVVSVRIGTHAVSVYFEKLQKSVFPQG